MRRINALLLTTLARSPLMHAEAKSQSQLEKDRLLQNDDTISQARSELEQTLKQQKTEACVPAVPSAVPVA
eukprot:s2480_g9.t4